MKNHTNKRYATLLAVVLTLGWGDKARAMAYTASAINAQDPLDDNIQKRKSSANTGIRSENTNRNDFEYSRRPLLTSISKQSANFTNSSDYLQNLKNADTSDGVAILKASLDASAPVAASTNNLKNVVLNKSKDLVVEKMNANTGNNWEATDKLMKAADTANFLTGPNANNLKERIDDVIARLKLIGKDITFSAGGTDGATKKVNDAWEAKWLQIYTAIETALTDSISGGGANHLGKVFTNRNLKNYDEDDLQTALRAVHTAIQVELTKIGIELKKDPTVDLTAVLPTPFVTLDTGADGAAGAPADIIAFLTTIDLSNVDLPDDHNPKPNLENKFNAAIAGKLRTVADEMQKTLLTLYNEIAQEYLARKGRLETENTDLKNIIKDRVETKIASTKSLAQTKTAIMKGVGGDGKNADGSGDEIFAKAPIDGLETLLADAIADAGGNHPLSEDPTVLRIIDRVRNDAGYMGAVDQHAVRAIFDKYFMLNQWGFEHPKKVVAANAEAGFKTYLGTLDDADKLNGMKVAQKVLHGFVNLQHNAAGGGGGGGGAAAPATFAQKENALQDLIAANGDDFLNMLLKLRDGRDDKTCTQGMNNMGVAVAAAADSLNGVNGRNNDGNDAINTAIGRINAGNVGANAFENIQIAFLEALKTVVGDANAKKAALDQFINGSGAGAALAVDAANPGHANYDTFITALGTIDGIAAGAAKETAIGRWNTALTAIDGAGGGADAAERMTTLAAAVAAVPGALAGSMINVRTKLYDNAVINSAATARALLDDSNNLKAELLKIQKAVGNLKTDPLHALHKALTKEINEFSRIILVGGAGALAANALKTDLENLQTACLAKANQIVLALKADYNGTPGTEATVANGGAFLDASKRLLVAANGSLSALNHAINTQLGIEGATNADPARVSPAALITELDTLNTNAAGIGAKGSTDGIFNADIELNHLDQAAGGGNGATAAAVGNDLYTYLASALPIVAVGVNADANAKTLLGKVIHNGGGALHGEVLALREYTDTANEKNNTANVFNDVNVGLGTRNTALKTTFEKHLRITNGGTGLDLYTADKMFDGADMTAALKAVWDMKFPVAVNPNRLAPAHVNIDDTHLFDAGLLSDVMNDIGVTDFMKNLFDKLGTNTFTGIFKQVLLDKFSDDTKAEAFGTYLDTNQKDFLDELKKDMKEFMDMHYPLKALTANTRTGKLMADANNRLTEADNLSKFYANTHYATFFNGLMQELRAIYNEEQLNNDHLDKITKQFQDQLSKIQYSSPSYYAPSAPSTPPALTEAEKKALEADKAKKQLEKAAKIQAAVREGVALELKKESDQRAAAEEKKEFERMEAARKDQERIDQEKRDKANKKKEAAAAQAALKKEKADQKNKRSQLEPIFRKLQQRIGERDQIDRATIEKVVREIERKAKTLKVTRKTYLNRNEDQRKALGNFIELALDVLSSQEDHNYLINLYNSIFQKKKKLVAKKDQVKDPVEKVENNKVEKDPVSKKNKVTTKGRQKNQDAHLDVHLPLNEKLDLVKEVDEDHFLENDEERKTREQNIQNVSDKVQEMFDDLGEIFANSTNSLARTKFERAKKEVLKRLKGQKPRSAINATSKYLGTLIDSPVLSVKNRKDLGQSIQNLGQLVAEGFSEGDLKLHEEINDSWNTLADNIARARSRSVVVENRGRGTKKRNSSADDRKKSKAKNKNVAEGKETSLGKNLKDDSLGKISKEENTSDKTKKAVRKDSIKKSDASLAKKDNKSANKGEDILEDLLSSLETQNSDKTADKAAKKTTDKAAKKTADKAVKKTADKAAKKTADKAAKKTADKAADKAVRKNSIKTSNASLAKKDNKSANKGKELADKKTGNAEDPLGSLLSSLGI